MRPPTERSVESVLDVDEVWAGHPVGFDLLTADDRQFVAYYDAERRLTVAQRGLSEETWTRTALDERVGWDSHNDVVMAVDSAGHLHVSGNMHVDPLVYFRSADPLDATTLRRAGGLLGRDEDAVTYPAFLDGPDGDLVFMYRDGGSGDGRRLLNAYEPETESWRRLLDEPLLDGRGEMNAYPRGPLRGPDGDYHLAWVWRDTPDAATNHDLSYARSPNLVDWERADGRPLDLPITADDGAVVDPVPAGEGLLNSNVAVGFDTTGRPVLSYHRRDDAGNTQVYDARLGGSGSSGAGDGSVDGSGGGDADDGDAGEWTVSQVSDWDYHWDFGGRGTLDDEILVDPVRIVDDRLVQTFWHAEHGPGRWILDPETLAVEQADVPWHGLPAELRRSKSGDDYEVQWAAESGQTADSSGADARTYALRWETLPANRDRAREERPAPTTLRLYAFE